MPICLSVGLLLLNTIISRIKALEEEVLKIFSCVVGAFTNIYDTQTRNNYLWITQRVASCGNRTSYTLHGSQLPSHRTNRAVSDNMILFST
ncbi:hypothetical protein SFRURICE_001034 [Spodoptera frugiperda]|nr:hypothetical protein SFRURICE_001034 [Spodoptera frugiperda]